MKHFLVILLTLLLGSLPSQAEKGFVNLTPRPKNVILYDGACVFPQSFAVGVRPNWATPPWWRPGVSSTR